MKNNKIVLLLLYCCRNCYSSCLKFREFLCRTLRNSNIFVSFSKKKKHREIVSNLINLIYIENVTRVYYVKEFKLINQ